MGGGNKQRKQGDIEILRKGDALILPEKMEAEQAIIVLKRKVEEENSERCIQEAIPVLPYEGAIALAKALKLMFGLTLEADGMGSDISIDVGVNQTMKIRWGRYELPMGGYVETGTTRVDGRLIFQLHAHVQGKHEHAIRNLIQKVREIAANESPYRGKAFNLTLTDEDDITMPMPRIKFLDLPKDPITVIVRPDIERDFQTCIWGPIQHTAATRASHIPLRRGILLAGKYGTGKTLTATRTAQIAVENGWTFIYLSKASDLPDALGVARQYEPCVMFVEDIDRVTGERRTDDVNEIINSLDGIDNKASEVMVVFTTNHPERINPAMQRPGRIDVAVNLLTPDAATAAKLLAFYAGGYLAPDQDLGPAGEKLNEVIPAQIREVVERAKLAVVATGAKKIVITAADLDYAAGSITRERGLFAKNGNGKADEKAGDFAARLGHSLLGVSLERSFEDLLRGNGQPESIEDR